MSTRPPPPGAPPSYAFVTRVYRRNLRPIVISTAFLAALWSLFSGVRRLSCLMHVISILTRHFDRMQIGWFRSYGIDKDANVPHIANLSLALGALYMAIFAIGIFGMLSAASQRVGLVRIYTFLAAFATLIVMAAGLTRVVTHFIWKRDIISECTELSTNKRVVYYGFWGPIEADILDPQEAEDWCTRYWDRDSWAQVVAFLILSVLGILFTLLTFAYYRQLLDPASPANASRAPSNQARMAGAFPTHYNPPYDASIPDLSYNYGPYSAQPQYAPPAGPPPGHMPPVDDGKPPGYTGGPAGFDGDAKDGKNPFADFGTEERDVTSRPGPGGPETFR
ncbi:hypothetical protein LshimejAT787_0701330 [Lyophyllum shimeji]|uniref:Uncharacterized protein n=1 Tax=Lyophyllum shimeji TaxID=47721 RepID=A0A9P3UNF4_LYOSH|nr:hypothetical protein LshimejAT787_0701330 [Lyophyllum shimeji]